MKTKLPTLILALALFAGTHTALAQGTAFSYQGRLVAGNTNFSGVGLFKFALLTRGANLSRQATAAVTLTNGSVASVSITDPGAGYLAAPAVSINTFPGPPPGSGAVVTAQISGGAVSGLILVNVGHNYSACCVYVTIAPPPDNYAVTPVWSDSGSTLDGIEPALPVTVPVNDGLFMASLGDPATMVPLDPGLFQTNALWLRLWFSADGTNYQRLVPDQPLLSTPYANFANTASNLLGSIAATQLAGSLPVSQVSGVLPVSQLPAMVVTNNENGVTLGGGFSGNGSGLTNLNASQLTKGTVPTSVLLGFQSPYYATVGGGQGNTANNSYAVVGGGFGNNASYLATVAGGYNNNASGYYAAVPGGANNTASGNNSFAAGQRAKAVHQGAFVWADSQPADFASTTNDQFLIRAQGGVGIGTNITAGNALTVAGNVAASNFIGNGVGLTSIPLSAVGPTGIFSILPQSFQPPLTNFVGGGPECVVAADVNGDGKVDLISANTASNTLTVLTNNGSGIFGINATLTIGARPFYVVAADLNGDGKPDLVCANLYSNTLTMLTNDGSGRFVLSATFTVGSGPASVVAADINGDGKVDLISANYDDDNLTILTNRGNGTFGYNATINVGRGPDSLAAADINGDGHVDLVCANYYDGTLTMLTNNGAGVFGLKTTLYINATPYSVAAADFNGDGKMDLVFVNYFGDNLTVLTNNGAGSYAPGPPVACGYAPVSVTPVDINGDGKLDLVVADSGFNTLTLLTNNGAGSFGSNTTYIVGYQPYSVAAADVNGDGKPDLISANAGDNTLTVLLSPPTVLLNSPALNPALVVFNGNFSGNGSGLTNLPSANLSGVLPASILPDSVVFNNLSGNGAYALGPYAETLAPGTWVWADESSSSVFSSTTADEFSVRAQNGLHLQSDTGIHLDGINGPIIVRDFDLFADSALKPKAGIGRMGLFMEPNTLTIGIPGKDAGVRYFQVATYSTNGTPTQLLRVDQSGNVIAAGTVTANGVLLASDRNAKENFKSLNPQAVLAKVAALPVTEWNYKSDDAAQKHIGPMAQDFQVAFQLSDDDKHISVVDEGGVALAAIQGLNQKLVEKDAKINELETRLNHLEQTLQSLTHKK